ncbi:MAG: NAD-dependent epimerase/dehydratase family protein [Thermoanaerobaculia bacterium]|nr:NAD-dependent epimerase/dehydratase family protein [Thermoanaerobaculia bacterium]
MTEARATRVLIAGCGDLGGRLGTTLARTGHRVWGLRRRVENLPAELEPIAGDLSAPDSLPSLPEVDIVAYTAAADGFSDEAYRSAYVEGVRTLLTALKRPPERWLHVGSTSVYTQSDGVEVDESSPTSPEQFAGLRLLEGERLLFEAAEERGFRAVVVRFAGIYGPGRTRLLDTIRQGQATCFEPPVWTNRIHVEDCVGVLDHLGKLVTPEPIYLGVDSEPALDGEVKRWLARRLDLPDPPVGQPSERARRLRSSKRCSNRLLLDSGYEFRYPDFRTGYGALIEDLPA